MRAACCPAGRWLFSQVGYFFKKRHLKADTCVLSLVPTQILPALHCRWAPALQVLPRSVYFHLHPTCCLGSDVLTLDVGCCGSLVSTAPGLSVPGWFPWVLGVGWQLWPGSLAVLGVCCLVGLQGSRGAPWWKIGCVAVVEVVFGGSGRWPETKCAAALLWPTPRRGVASVPRICGRF